MEHFILVLEVLGYVCLVAGWAGCLIAIWTKNEEWGLWSYVIYLVMLIGIFKYWKETRGPFVSIIIGAVLLLAAVWVRRMADDAAGVIM